MSVAVRLSQRIVHRGDGGQVLKGPAPELAQAVPLHRAGVGRQDQLRAVHRQHAGALREFPVVADHAAHHNFPQPGVQRDYGKIRPRCEEALHIKVADMHLGVIQHPPPEAVKQSHGISRQRVIRFQIGDTDSHFQLRCQPAERGHKVAVRRDGLCAIVFFAVHLTVAAAPHFREQGDIRAEGLRLSAGVHTLLKIPFQCS